MFFSSVSAGWKVSTSRKVRSTWLPVSMLRSLQRYRDCPFPGLTNWKSTTM